MAVAASQGMQQSCKHFVQSPNSQMMHRQALMWEIQDSAGDSPQMNDLIHREGSNQMLIKGSPQNQSLRQTDRQLLLPSDQGMLSIEAQVDTSNPQSD